MAKQTPDPGAYSVGYGNPPKHTQFQKGQSGNPSGKSKKEESIKAQLKKLAGAEITVKKSGASHTMSHQEAMVHAVFAKAIKGDLPAIKFIAEHLGVDLSDSDLPKQLELTSADLAALKSHTEWLEVYEAAEAEAEANPETPNSMETDDDDTDSTG